MASTATAGLQEPFKSNVEALLAAAGGKVTLPPGHGLRSTARQIQLRRINGCPDVWTSPASSCRVPTAIPGTSKHEVGLAVDLAGDLELAGRLAPKFGLERTVMPEEPWHFEPADRSSAGGRIIQGIAGGITGLGGDLVSAAVDPFVEALRRLTITGLFLAGGALLVVTGAYRAVTNAVDAGKEAAEFAATKGAGGGAAAKGAAAKGARSTATKSRRSRP